MKNIYSFFKILIFIIFLSTGFISFAQNSGTNSGGQVNQVQPSIIIVPLKVEGQNYRKLIEDPTEGFNRRTAINVVDNAIKTRGFPTIDFVGQLEKVKTTEAYTNGTQKDEQSDIINSSGADIFITVDINVSKSANGTEVSLFLVARETATGAKLSTSKLGNSGKYYTDDIHKLTTKALDNIKEDFLNELQISFTKIVNEGRSVFVSFKIAQGSAVNFKSEVGNEGDLLSEAISDWLKKNSYKGYAKPGGSSALELIYEDVRLPLKDQSTGLNYDPKNDFGRLIRKFLRTLKVDAEIDAPQLGQIVITIKGKLN